MLLDHENIAGQTNRSGKTSRTKTSVTTLVVTCPRSPTGAHWWNIDTPDGCVSNGVCKYCLRKKEFPSWMDEKFNPVERAVNE